VDEQGKEHLRRVRAGAQRMAVLIEDLLRLSRITRWEMERAKADISDLARKTVASLRQSQPGRDVEVIIEEGLAADGDIRLLRVVMDNLLGNAWKFSGKTANARIEVGKKTIADSGCRIAEKGQGRPAEERQARAGSETPISQIAYFVRDNGVGFDMAYVDKLFGAFQRLHSTAEFEGTGIGLATVQRAILRHGGRVWAHGEVGKGATFFSRWKREMDGG
jgi:signal transduction histidine kinase